MAVKVHILGNGLRVVLYPESYRSAYMTLITRGGPRFENPEELGISHILEHLVVRNPDLNYAMESLGEGLYNAETDAEDVSYFISFPKRNVLKGTEIFARLWIAPVSPADSERERTVLGIEYAGLNHDSPEFALGNLWTRAAWLGHPLVLNDLLPWQENLSHLTLEQFSAFRRKINCGRNTVLAVVGDVPVQPFLEVLERTLGTVPEGELLPIQRSPVPDREGLTIVKQVGALEQVHCLLGFPLPRLRSAERRALEVLSLYLGDPNLFSSVLFRRVREELSLVYYIESGVEAFYDSGLFAVRWICPPANLETVFNVVLEEMMRVAREGISQEDFRRARRVYSLQKESELEEPFTISIALAEEMIRSGRVSNPNLGPRQARRARRSETIRFVHNYLNPQKAVLALYGPVEDLEPRILI